MQTATSQEFTQTPIGDSPWDVAIIGSGPAGFTACIYTTRGAASTILFAGENWGGQLMLTTTVDNYPGLKGIQGPELMQKMRDHASSFGVKMINKYITSLETNGDLFLLKSDTQEYKSKSVIIATGAETMWLGIPGEDMFRGKGVSSCAPCDAPFFKEKKVVVVGGGDSAMEEALVLSKYASEVSIIHRRDSFRASQAMQQKVLSAGIDVFWDSEVTEVVGNQIVTSLKVKTSNSSKYIDKIKGELIPKKNAKIIEQNNSSTTWEIPVDGVFVAIGHAPATDVFKDGDVDLDEKGYVIRREQDGFWSATSRRGIFVAGDVHDYHYRQAITAAGFGCMAAMDCLKFLDLPPPSY